MTAKNEMHLVNGREKIKISDDCYLRFIQYNLISEDIININILFLTGSKYRDEYDATPTNQKYIALGEYKY